MRIYRFYLTLGSVVTEVFPLNFLETQLVDQQESGCIFYRRNFEGSLTFVNNNGADDFDLLYLAECVDPCGKILLEIQRDGVYYWNGYFSTTDGNWDLDKCTFIVEPLNDDDYVDMLEIAGVQYNLVDEVTTCDTRLREIYPFIDTNWWTPGIVLHHNMLLTDILDYLAEKIKPGCTVSSTYFTAATNPVTLDDNMLLKITMAQKSNVRADIETRSDIPPYNYDPATLAMMSWKDLMTILWGIFEVAWEYNSATDTIHVEHISWFSHVAGMDLRSQVLADSNAYFYDKENMPKYEEFTFMEADRESFVGVNIWYDNKCVNQNPSNNKNSIALSVTTDISFAVYNLEEISDDGWFMFCNYEKYPNALYIKANFSALNNDFGPNMDLSWGNLHNCYFRHNRILMEGYMNDVLTTFWTVQKHMVQECHAVVCPSDNYNADDLITTKLSDDYFGNIPASVRKSMLKPSGEMKFELLYGAADNVNTGVANQFRVHGFYYFDDVDLDNLFETAKVWWCFNMPAPGNFSVRVRVRFGIGGVYDPWGSWQTENFTAGQVGDGVLDFALTSWLYDGSANDKINPLFEGYFQLEVEYTGTDMDLILIHVDNFIDGEYYMASHGIYAGANLGSFWTPEYWGRGDSLIYTEI